MSSTESNGQFQPAPFDINLSTVLFFQSWPFLLFLQSDMDPDARDKNRRKLAKKCRKTPKIF